MDVLSVFWIALMIVFGVMSLSIHRISKALPNFLHELTTYGRLRRISKSKWECFSVQKEWFTLFYFWGLIWNVVLICYFIHHVKGWTMSSFPLSLIEPFLKMVVFFPDNFNLPQPSCCCSVVHLQVLIALILVCIQTGRRLFECLCVTVFNPDSRIHLAHFVFGILFYTALGPGIIRQLESNDIHDCSSVSVGSHCVLLLGVGLFVWSSWHQNKCHRILAEIRTKGRRHLKVTGPSVSKGYSIPHGDWFQYCSSPHYLAEIIIYLSLVITLGGYNIYSYFTLLVTALNLSYTATLTHHWYLKTYKQYPKNRKIIIPLLY